MSLYMSLPTSLKPKILEKYCKSTLLGRGSACISDMH
jgi:hypothetical protein